ncbi:MAG: imidazole glycerol phosphate synthase subunit HisF [Candidatus Micrarchaeota archaeon]
MLAKRIIPCLDMADGRVVKGTNFIDLRDAGDAVELAKYYYENGADELCFLDITATVETREPIYEMIKKVAKEIFIPFSVGGGIKTVEDAERILKCGAEKIVIGSAAVRNPNLIQKLANKFGSQAVVISIDAKRNGMGWNQFINGGRVNSEIDTIEFAKTMEQFGAGEILLNSIDKDGTKKGFDIELCNAVCKAVNIPVIASSGAKNVGSFVEVFQKTDVNAALAASIFHFGEVRIGDLKNKLKEKGVEIRD